MLKFYDLTLRCFVDLYIDAKSCDLIVSLNEFFSHLDRSVSKTFLFFFCVCYVDSDVYFSIKKLSFIDIRQVRQYDIITLSLPSSLCIYIVRMHTTYNYY